MSIVSHGHGRMVGGLVESLLEFPEVKQIVVTRNVPERSALVEDRRILVIDNLVAKGFGANHNAAFLHCTQPTFCVLNPDIEFCGDPFSDLLAVLMDNGVAVVAPLVKSPAGGVEDSVRHFPTLASLVRKIVGGAEGRQMPEEGRAVFYPEWVAGMFMLFRSSEFRRLGGFDEGFYLYYEDVDICVRAWKKGLKVGACTAVNVIHDARRGSRRNLKHLRWHIASVGRYFWKHWGRLPIVG